MRDVPWWAVASSAAAPVVLTAGWTVAAALQPGPFNSVTSCVSVLAEPGMASRWLMTTAFAMAGVCEIVTGLGLRPAAVPGRLLLMTGGAAGLLVAATPDHPGGSLAHALWAGVGLAALATWPAGAWRRGLAAPWALRPGVCAVVGTVLLCLLAWFLAELAANGGQAGLAERVLGVAQAGWPLAVTLSSGQGAGKRLGPHSPGRLPLSSVSGRLHAGLGIVRRHPARVSVVRVFLASKPGREALAWFERSRI